MEQRAWDLGTIRMVITHLSKGKSEAEIAAELKCSVELISHQIDLLILRHHKSDDSNKHIAKMLHISPARVHRVIANHHIEKGEITMDDLLQYSSLNPVQQKSDDSQKIIALCTEIRDMLTATNLSLGPDLDQRMVHANSTAISNTAKKVLERMGELSPK